MERENKYFHLPPISPSAPGTLYQQIVEAIKREVSEGRLKPGQPLPSFRSLAESLLVSLITVKRAYDELEHDGIIFRKQGLGTFISENGVVKNRKMKRRMAEHLMNQAIGEALESDMDEHEILEMTKQVIRQRKGGAKS